MTRQRWGDIASQYDAGRAGWDRQWHLWDRPTWTSVLVAPFHSKGKLISQCRLLERASVCTTDTNFSWSVARAATRSRAGARTSDLGQDDEPAISLVRVVHHPCLH